MTHFDLMVKGGTLVTPTSRFAADIAVADERIVAMVAPDSLSLDADQVVDATDRYVLPGLVDGHVHFREPGLEYKEDFGTGSRAAVMGGVTTVLDMPNTLPPTSSADLVNRKRQLAESKSYCDFGLYGLLVDDSILPVTMAIGDPPLIVYVPPASATAVTATGAPPMTAVAKTRRMCR